MHSDLLHRYGVVVLALLLLLTAVAYWPGLSGGFLFDDVITITENPHVLIDGLSAPELQRAAYSFHGGPLGRPFSMLTVGINHALTGLDPFWFKLTNLSIHLVCGIAVWILTRLLLTAYGSRHNPTPGSIEIYWISASVAALWLLHPFQLTSVLYIIQRMTSLAAFFTFCGLAMYAWGRLRQLQGKHGGAPVVVGFVLCGSLAALSKENGLLLPLVVFLVEWLFFGFSTRSSGGRRLLIAFLFFAVALPALLAIGLVIVRFDWVLAGYEARDFSLMERLLTQARVTWFYINMIVLPDPTRMGLYHDDFRLSTGWLTPVTTLAAVLGHAAVLFAAGALRRRAPLATFGVLFFYAGHLMESTIFSLELVHEHRNYLPAYGLILVLVYYLSHRRVRERIFVLGQSAAIALLVAAMGASTAVRARYWAYDVDLALVEVTHHPYSARSNMQAGRVFFAMAEKGIEPEHNGQRARQFFAAAQRADGYNLAGSFALLVLDDIQGREVNTAMLDELEQKLATLPLSSANTNALIRVSRCTNDGPCNLGAEVLSRLFRAALSNDTVRGRRRAQILTEVTQLAISQGALDIALYCSYEAMQILPSDAQVQLNHAHLLIHNGAFKDASLAIDRAKAIDRFGFLADRIREQERLLSALMEVGNPAVDGAAKPASLVIVGDGV